MQIKVSSTVAYNFNQLIYIQYVPCPADLDPHPAPHCPEKKNLSRPSLLDTLQTKNVSS